MDAIIKSARGNKSRDSSNERNKTRSPSRERQRETDEEKMKNELDMQDISSINNYEVIKAIIARILINQNILNRKAKIEVEHDLDSYYYNFPEQDQQISEEQVNTTVDNRLKGFESELLQKKLNYANNIQQIQAPTFYSTPRKTEDKLTTHKFCWQGKNKFSGEKHQNVLELLNHLNQVQNWLKMCESEFKDFMLQNVTKEVFTQVRQEFNAGSSVSTVYTLLQVLYNKEDSPAIYKDKLKNYKATRTDTMHSAFAMVRKLTTMSLDPTLSEQMRNQLLNIESLYGFVNCLPLKSKLLVQEKLSKYQQSQPEIPDTHKFFASLVIFRESIDRDIAQNGVNPHTRPSKYNTYALDRTEQEHNTEEQEITTDYASSEDDRDENEEYIPKRYLMAMIRNQNRTRGTTRDNHRGRQGTSGRTNFRSGNNQEKDRNHRGPRNFRESGSKYCSLCGATSHNSVDTCYKMRDDNFKIVNVVPIQKSCSVCKDRLHKELFHPEKFCFLRDSLKRFKKQKTPQ